jgi:type I restriction enzyme M protein
VVGDAYEYLIKKFADATNKKAGEFYTPRSIVRLMIEMLDPREGETIYDPACGTGGMLLAAVQHVKDRHGDVKRLWGKLFGQEKNLTTSSIARMNLFLHGIEDFQIVRGDTLRNPVFFDGRPPGQRFDCVLANPPFSLEKWGEEVWINDPFGRNFAGLPPSSSGDFAWVQHMVKSMAAVTGSHGRRKGCRRVRCSAKDPSPRGRFAVRKLLEIFEAEGMLEGREEEAHRSRVKGRLRVYAAWRSFP